MLTPQEIEQANRITGMNAPLDPTAPPSRASQIRALGKASSTAKEPITDSNMLSVKGKPIVGGMVGGILKPVVAFGQSIGAGSQATRNADLFAQTSTQHDEIANNLSKAIATNKAEGKDTSRLETALQNHTINKPTLEDFTGDVINKTDEQVIGEGVGTLLAATSGGGLSAGKSAVGNVLAKQATLGQTIGTGAKIGGIYGATGAVGSAMEQNKSLGDVAKEGAVGGATGAMYGAGTAGLIHGATKVPSAINKIKSVSKGSPVNVEAKSLQSSIDAVNPDLTGKKLTNAYKQVATGKRDIIKPSIFHEQGLTPDEKAIGLGTRLHDLKLSNKNHVENLKKLGTGLDDTEVKLTKALDGDPEINFNADKPALYEKLNGIKTEMPREFSAIKDSKSVFNNVVDFAKEITAKADDSIKGIRQARTKFDSQAMREYPNAYKDGRVDTATPAGRAIKTVRDSMNEHLYTTAPNGSEIQTLIGREADIFRALDNIAPKAVKGQGKNILLQWAKEHPTAAKIAGYGVVGALGAEVGHLIIP